MLSSWAEISRESYFNSGVFSWPFIWIFVFSSSPVAGGAATLGSSSSLPVPVPGGSDSLGPLLSPSVLDGLLEGGSATLKVFSSLTPSIGVCSFPSVPGGSTTLEFFSPSSVAGGSTSLGFFSSPSVAGCLSTWALFSSLTPSIGVWLGGSPAVSLSCFSSFCWCLMSSGLWIEMKL